MARCIAKRQGAICEFQKVYNGLWSVQKNWGQALFDVILPDLSSLCQGFKGFEAGQKAAPPPFNESWRRNKTGNV